jgi:phenylacetate-coenzyme A ligase PaaK-like adenylate-forming protein
MSSLYTQLCSSVLFPLHERLKSHASTALRRELEQSQWLSPDALAQQQAKRLREFLSRVERDVPYYAQQFAQAGVAARDIQSVADLQRLPLLTKELIRANTEQLKSRSAGKVIRYNTGGSSGEPLVFFMGMDRVSHDVAAKWRATRWWGVDIGDPEIVLWGSPVELGKQDRIKALRDRMLRSHLLPAFAMSEANMREYLARIAAIRPPMLFGYASALALLARFAAAERRDMTGLGIKVAFATGETLYPDQRAIIEQVFGAPVANGYGSRDGGFVAHQCPQGSLHISTEHIVVELLGPDGRPSAPGESGEIVLTHLATADFPFIRYRTGDVGVAARAPCACGRGLPVLAEVHGRSTDFIRTRDGNTLHALALIYEVRDKPGVKAFKFVQAGELSLELLLVAGPELTEEVERSIRAGILRRMGADSELTIRRVAEIPPEKSGKYRYVVSAAGAAASAGRS